MGVRFAPSPTGRFHVGNLRTAWISHAWARRLAEPWVLRFEDIDRPRVAPGAQESQLEDMAALGLHPDQVLIQSAAHARHRRVLERAVREGRAYVCRCSRKEVQEALRASASAPHAAPPVYSGQCRHDAHAGPPSAGEGCAWRFRSEADPSGAQDFIVGRTEPGGDWVPAYNWACAIDDHDGGHRLLVRAWDLGPVLAQQREIHAWLTASEGRPGAPPPAVFHAALVVQDDGHRLEKRTRGVTLDELRARGIPPARLREIFASSFAMPPDAPAPGGAGGEPRERLTLSELGLFSAP
jgi:glutamyl-tRNA synthetase